MNTLAFVRRTAAGLLLAAAIGSAQAQSLTTAFTYQGRLDEVGVGVTTPVDLRFRLYTLAAGGLQVGPSLAATGVMPADGYFTVQLDFGSASYTGQRRWLEIDVAHAGSSSYTTLSPRQELTVSPHAAYSISASTAASAATATNALNLGGQAASFYTNAGNLSSGTLATGRLAGTYSGALAFTSASNAFSGSGAGLTNLNASNLLTGTLPDGRLLGTYSGALAFTSASNAFTGSGAGLTNLNASNLLTGVLPNARLLGTYSGAVAFTSPSNAFTGSGAGLTNLNASNLLTGVLPSARLLGTYSNALAFTSGSNAFTGSGAGLTSLNAANISAGTLADARLSSNIALLNTIQTFTAEKIFTGGVGINTSPFDSELEVMGNDFYTLTTYNTHAGYGIAIRGVQRGGADGYPGNGAGVLGTSDTAYGVAGSSNSGTGVWGLSHSETASGDGVYGLASGSGRGVYGIGYSTTAPSRGVRGDARSTLGVGVEGVATATTGSTIGVRGESSSSDGVGVQGAATSTTGVVYGVRGDVSTSGWLAAGVHGQSDWSTTYRGAAVLGSRAVDLGTHTILVGGAAVYGITGVGPGVVGWTDGLDNYVNAIGVLGHSSGEDPDAAGVIGEMYGSSGTGVLGWAHRGTGLDYGGRFGTNSTGGYGALGQTASTSTSTGGTSGLWGKGGTGVRAESTVSNGNGLVAIANGSSGYAIFGQSDTGYAGYFYGNVYVSGNFNVGGTKSFIIDHPQDPANKYLVHSCVESDQQVNIYRGNIVLDSAGEAVVSLPAWFESANRDYSYQLTAIGAAAPLLHIADEINANTFRIAGGPAGIKVSWTVTAVRDDAYARTNPMQVEQAKPAHERGTYLHPELFGKPASMSVESAKISLPTEVLETITPPNVQTIAPGSR